MNSRVRKRFFAAAALVCGLAAGCEKRDAAVPNITAITGGPRVVLISIDTCRADHLSCYGYAKETTPNIDALARDGVRFENAYTPAPITRPAHASMLTGLVPPVHRVRDNADERLPQAATTLAEISLGTGMKTAAFVSAYVLDSRFGLDQGFESYDDDFENPVIELGVLTRLGEDTSSKAVDWLSENGQDPFFVFIHYWDPHIEYGAPEPFASQYRENPYAGEIAYTDYCISQVIAQLKSMGIYDETMIVVTGDHGELLGEHGEDTHGYFIYRNALRVPLVIKPPGGAAGISVPASVSLIDIVPTVCSILGIEAPELVQGRDLSFALFGNKIDDEDVYCESLWPTKYDASALMGLIHGNRQYIESANPELYDFSSDRGQLDNRVASEPKLATEMYQRLQTHVDEAALKRLEAETADLDAAARNNLKALGYLSDVPVSDSLMPDTSLADPKDLIDYHNASCTVLTLMSEQRFSDAATLLGRLIKERPDSAQAYFDMAWVHLSQGQFAQARPFFEKFLRMRPDSALAETYLGLCHARLGAPDKALVHMERAVELAPDDPTALSNLGVELAALGRIVEAEELLKRVLIVDPEEPQILATMASVHAKSGRAASADQYYQQALAADQDDAGIRNNYGLFLAGQGEFDKAAEVLEDGLKLNQDRPELHFNLARVYRQLGRADDAIDELERVIVIDASIAAAHEALADVLFEQGRSAEAVLSWKRVIERAPESVTVLNSLAWVIGSDPQSSAAEIEQARVFAERACRLTRDNNPSLLDTLAMVSARAGLFKAAIETGTRAASLAREAGDEELAQRIEDRVRSYRTKRGGGSS